MFIVAQLSTAQLQRSDMFRAIHFAPLELYELVLWLPYKHSVPTGLFDGQTP